MLKKILSLEQCASCRNCCVFQEKSRWETPVVSEEKAQMIRKKLKQENCVIPYEKSYVLASVKRDKVLPKGAEPYRCVALDEEKGCTLTKDEKPFDCSLWPIRVMKKENHIFIMLARGCHTVDDTFIEKVNKLLLEGLKEQIVKEVINNPDIIKPYSDDYIELCDITDNISNLQ